MTAKRQESCSTGIKSMSSGSLSGAKEEDMVELLGMIRSQISVCPWPYPGMERHAPPGPSENGGERLGDSGTLHGDKRDRG